MIDGLNINNLKFIVFVVESDHKQHDGRIFAKLEDARQFLNDCIKENWGDKFILGQFLFEKEQRDMLITLVETFGFKGDVKKINQLTLF